MAVVNDTIYNNPHVLISDPPTYTPPPTPPKEVIEVFYYAERHVFYLPLSNCAALNALAANPATLLGYHISQITTGTGTNLDVEAQVGLLSPFKVALTDQPLYQSATGTLIQATGSVISTPYIPTDLRYTLNAHRPSSSTTNKTPNPSDPIYGWTEINAAEAEAKPDGSLFIKPTPRSEATTRQAKINVVNDESANLPDYVANYNNQDVGAFTLYFNIIPGDPAPADPNAPAQGPPWTMKIEFGEVIIEFQEGKTETKVTLGNKIYAVNFSPSSTPKNAADASTYALSIIPVWNGILVSDLPPSSNGFLAKAIFLRKSPEISIQKALEQKFNSNALATPPRYNYGAALPLKGGTPFCEIVKVPATQTTMGTFITTAFKGCGGRVRFVPIFFTRQFRSYLPLKGNNPPPAQAGLACPVWPHPPFTYNVPVASYVPTDTFSFTAEMNTVAAADPVKLIATTLQRSTKGHRHPIETWGNVVAYLPPPGAITDEDPTEEAGLHGMVFQNTEAPLPFGYIPEARIKKVSVTRSLDGTDATLTWDRYDPVLGLAARPAQAAGGIRITAQGGLNTIGGVIFTGLAFGNSESDNPGANEIEVPMKGREAKLRDADGGLRLFNLPFFDGFDNRDVMAWLAQYGGVPITTLATAYNLPSGTLMAPVIDIHTGTAVWEGMEAINKFASTLTYFNRFGTLIHINTRTSTGTNWSYPDTVLESYSDRPDVGFVRNTVVVAGLVAVGQPNLERLVRPDQQNFEPPAQPVMVGLQFATTPSFSWSKAAFIVIPGIVQPNQLNLSAIQVALDVQRPRATGSVTIPGNANIELLDTFNLNWLVTSIQHEVDCVGKRWSTTLSLEYVV